MKRFRAVFRGARLLLLTLGLYLGWAVGHLALGLVAPGRRAAWRRGVFRAWGRGACRVLAVRLEVVGAPPRAGALLVANHLSYLDIAVLASQLSTVFVSKSEVAHWPLIGAAARAMGTIFLARQRKRALPDVNRQIECALAGGDGVVVFPEGTSTKGDRVAPFRPSLLAPAAEARLDVHVAVLRYATTPPDTPASLSVCWWGDMAFAPHVLKLLELERIEARLEFAPQTHADGDRKRLAEKLQDAVNSRFRPIP